MLCVHIYKMYNLFPGDLESLEKSCERRLEAQKLEYEEQIYQLRQENFVLNAKVSDACAALCKGGQKSWYSKDYILVFFATKHMCCILISIH